METRLIQQLYRTCFLFLAMSAWVVPVGRADPATLFFEGRRGGIRVMIWMDPAAPRPGRVILRALVLEESGEAVLQDVGLSSRLQPPQGSVGVPMDPVCGGGDRRSAVESGPGWIPWQRSGFGNQLLQGIEMWLETPGLWSLELRIRVRGRMEEFQVGIPVEPSRWETGVLVWGVGLPALVVAWYGAAKGRGHRAQGRCGDSGESRRKHPRRLPRLPI